MTNKYINIQQFEKVNYCDDQTQHSLTRIKPMIPNLQQSGDIYYDNIITQKLEVI